MATRKQLSCRKESRLSLYGRYASVKVKMNVLALQSPSFGA